MKVRFIIGLLFIGLLLVLWNCNFNGSLNSGLDVSKQYSQLQLPEKPNILWLVTEDMGPYLPAFGDSTIQTPNLSRLADEGVIYPHLYSVSGVCAPSRAAIATGMYPSGIGANHMRVNSYMETTGLPAYEAVPPSEVKMISELLRKEGYYCTNNYKTDYQFKAPLTAWDESSPYAHWRNREEGQPFYAVFNFTETHESGLFEPYGYRHIETRHYREGDRSYKWEGGRMSEEETAVHLSKECHFNIPPYLPSSDTVRRDMWKAYNNIAEMDRQVGVVLKQLEDDGLLENTIIFFYGDHGGPLPRQKRLIYDSGLNTPMIIRFPKKQLAGSKDEQLISFVDFAPTLLSLVGAKPMEHLQGQAFLGEFMAEQPRRYIHAAADRFDGFTDAIRAVRDKQFKYIRNYRPHQGYYLPIAYREQIPTMQELLHLHHKGQLDPLQAQWFRDHKPVEELFDCEADPHELINLANQPEYKTKLEELRHEMDRWIAAIGDQPNLPEAELVKQLWNGSNEQPQTKKPFIVEQNGKLVINCETQGASIAYRIVENDGTLPLVWKVYDGPFELSQGGHIQVLAHRIGYLPSDKVDYTYKISVVDFKVLEQKKQLLSSDEEDASEEYVKLIAKANALLDGKVYSVTHKEGLPPSGDKHDYMTIGPYWWPNPDTPDGLPYIRKDGEINPESRDNYTDFVEADTFFKAIAVLKDAFYFSNNKAYADKAIQLIEAWFLKPETKMNPNLNYGQSIPGLHDGRPFGIIEFGKIKELIKCLEVLEFKNSLPAATKEGMKLWLHSYADWLQTSDIGIQEANTKNNHGTHYDDQLLSIKLYLGQIDFIRSYLSTITIGRIFSQIEPDGSQPRELSRTKSFSYSVMNLHGFLELAILGKKVGVDLLVMESEDGRSIKRGYQYLLPYLTNEKHWEHEQIVPIEKPMISLKEDLRLVGSMFDEDEFSLKLQ